MSKAQIFTWLQLLVMANFRVWLWKWWLSREVDNNGKIGKDTSVRSINIYDKSRDEVRGKVQELKFSIINFQAVPSSCFHVLIEYLHSFCGPSKTMQCPLFWIYNTFPRKLNFPTLTYLTFGSMIYNLQLEPWDCHVCLYFFTLLSDCFLPFPLLTKTKHFFTSSSFLTPNKGNYF